MPDTEKISFNMSVVDLGQVDLLVDQGFYSSRTDFLIAAVRRQIESHSVAVRQAVEQKVMTVGMTILNRKELEKRVAASKPLDIRVVGVLKIDDDVTPALANAAIKSVSVFGKIRAQPEVMSAILFKQKKRD
jgi:Arc/MetJ-type ribon-helix-helix transcriptional regulator